MSLIVPCWGMPASPARQFAFEVLLAVEEAGGYASDLLHSSRARACSPADRRLATELVLGVLRWRGALDYAIAAAARRPVHKIPPPARAALRLGAYQLRQLDRIPASAAVHESVELAKPAGRKTAAFVNAVLRHLPRAPIAVLLAGEGDLARRREAEFSHPAWLLERWSRNFTPEAAAIAEYDNQPPPVACWMSAPGAQNMPGITLAPGRLLRSCHRVTGGDVTKTPAWRAGRIWIQDETSQLIAHLLQPRPGDWILDVCAAPGSKTALLHRLAPAAPIVAMERHLRRAQLLKRRLQRAPGEGAVHVLAADAARAWPLDRKFARILVDAPCSGTGTLARNPEIRWRLKPEDVARLAGLQLDILRHAAAALAPGGRLVYSVCSLEPEEGPQVVRRVLAAEPGLRCVPMAEELQPLRQSGELLVPASGLLHGLGLRVLPGAFASDGFFAAVLARV